MTLFLCLIISLLALLVQAQEVSIYHRLWDGITHPLPQFVLRSSVPVEGGFGQLKVQEKSTIVHVRESDVYQVGVKAAFDPSSWIISSTKAVCY